MSALLQGSGATMLGYSWYGLTVYPGYELLRRAFAEAVGPEAAWAYRVPLVLAAGACATVVACIGVCPAESVRIRQVSEPSLGGGAAVLRTIVGEQGWGKLYEGFPPLLIRQVSFGMVKFLIFDFFSEAVYRALPDLAASSVSQAGVSLLSGLVAGVCAAIVSQPADTVLSTMNRQGGAATVFGTTKGLVQEGGFGALFRGLGGRCLWSGAIISGQFLLYDIGRRALHVSADDLKIFLDVLGSTLPTR
ncbi:mitochondrial carrier domain-containing protein [Tribonema minus]|uniref:Mitochondrial carrier domain-containing protein n=1 Tax=Tribonema minus TaxID=303371 RepID=A0A835YSD1_9STRA|nr:mitochondrial carrier domain-containing protein [Tribonema minus]